MKNIFKVYAFLLVLMDQDQVFKEYMGASKSKAQQTDSGQRDPWHCAVLAYMSNYMITYLGGAVWEERDPLVPVLSSWVSSLLAPSVSYISSQPASGNIPPANYNQTHISTL